MVKRSSEIAILSRRLSQNILELRQKRGLTQSELSAQSGLPRSTITYLESGESNPSLKNLARIAGTLQVSLEELLSEPQSECRLIKAKDIPFTERASRKAKLFKLLPDPLPGMEIDRLELEAGARMGGVPHVSGTREYLTCVKGQVILHTGGESYELEPGDLLAFPGDRHHAYENPTRSKTLCFSVVMLSHL